MRARASAAQAHHKNNCFILSAKLAFMTRKRQFITDEAGKPVAVILPIKDYNRIRRILESSHADVNLTQEDEATLLARSTDDLQAELNDLDQDVSPADLNDWLAAFNEA